MKCSAGGLRWVCRCAYKNLCRDGQLVSSTMCVRSCWEIGTCPSAFDSCLCSLPNRLSSSFFSLTFVLSIITTTLCACLLSRQHLGSQSECVQQYYCFTYLIFSHIIPIQVRSCICLVFKPKHQGAFCLAGIVWLLWWQCVIIGFQRIPFTCCTSFSLMLVCWFKSTLLGRSI